MSNTLSEDVIVFNALSPSITDINLVYSALRGFFELKKSIDPSDRYNFILFEEDGPNYLEDFTSDSEAIINALKSLELNITPSNVAGGIFTAITLIIEVFKFIPDKFINILRNFFLSQLFCQVLFQAYAIFFELSRNSC